MEFDLLIEIKSRKYWDIRSILLQKFHDSQSDHPNPLIQQLTLLTIPNNPLRRLKRH